MAPAEPVEPGTSDRSDVAVVVIDPPNEFPLSTNESGTTATRVARAGVIARAGRAVARAARFLYALLTETP